MSKLTHIKTKQQDYYIDEQHRLQGEYKEYWLDGKLYEHSFHKDGKLHGEFKDYYSDGKLYKHSFHKNGNKISKKEYNEWQLKEKIEKCLS